MKVHVSIAVLCLVFLSLTLPTHTHPPLSAECKEACEASEKGTSLACCSISEEAVRCEYWESSPLWDVEDEGNACARTRNSLAIGLITVFAVLVGATTLGLIACCCYLCDCCPVKKRRVARSRIASSSSQAGGKVVHFNPPSASSSLPAAILPPTATTPGILVSPSDAPAPPPTSQRRPSALPPLPGNAARRAPPPRP